MLTRAVDKIKKVSRDTVETEILMNLTRSGKKNLNILFSNWTRVHKIVTEYLLHEPYKVPDQVFVLTKKCLFSILAEVH